MNSTDKKLYELFSDKTLSEGCKILSQETPDDNRILTLFRTFSEDGDCFLNDIWHICHYKTWAFIILWHEPQLHDVFRRAQWRIFHLNEKALVLVHTEWEDIKIPYNPTLPILAQNEETKLAIISLFS